MTLPATASSHGFHDLGRSGSAVSALVHPTTPSGFHPWASSPDTIPCGHNPPSKNRCALRTLGATRYQLVQTVQSGRRLQDR